MAQESRYSCAECIIRLSAGAVILSEALTGDSRFLAQCGRAFPQSVPHGSSMVLWAAQQVASVRAGEAETEVIVPLKPNLQSDIPSLLLSIVRNETLVLHLRREGIKHAMGLPRGRDYPRPYPRLSTSVI